LAGGPGGGPLGGSDAGPEGLSGALAERSELLLVRTASYKSPSAKSS